MLKGIDPVLSADLLWVLEAMGHGDTLALVDANFPAQAVANETATGELVRLPGLTLERVAKAILSVLPVDTFGPGALKRMEVVDEPATIPDIQKRVMAECAAAAPGMAVEGVERFAFYEAAKQAFAVVQVGDPRFYGCFLLRKGVIGPD